MELCKNSGQMPIYILSISQALHVEASVLYNVPKRQDGLLPCVSAPPLKELNQCLFSIPLY